MSLRTTAARKSGDSASRAAWDVVGEVAELELALRPGLVDRQALGGVLGERVGLLALLAPDAVEEQARRDPVQPARTVPGAVGVE